MYEAFLISELHWNFSLRVFMETLLSRYWFNTHVVEFNLWYLHLPQRSQVAQDPSSSYYVIVWPAVTLHHLPTITIEESIMSQLVNMHYQVCSAGPSINNRHYHPLGKSKGLELTSQELGQELDLYSEVKFISIKWSNQEPKSEPDLHLTRLFTALVNQSARPMLVCLPRSQTHPCPALYEFAPFTFSALWEVKLFFFDNLNAKHRW